MYVEGEFYDVAAFWHLQIPCIFDPITKRFRSSVEISNGAKFRFYYMDNEYSSKVYLLSEMYPSVEQYDGSMVNTFIETPDTNGEGYGCQLD